MSENETELLDEQLTAYLDGELPAQESSALERRLVDDPALRQRLAELRQAYDMLDNLPETPVNQSFTQSTIAMVVEDVRKSSAQPSVRTSQVPVTKRSWFAWPHVLLPITVMAVLGCVLGAMVALLQTRFELSNLDVIANLPGLQDVGEWKVARELAKEKEIVEYVSERYEERLVPLVPDSLWSRRNWVLSLNATQVSKLESSRELLLKLPADSIVRLEAIQSQIDEQEDADSINQTIRVIGHVLDSLPTAKRHDLDGLPSEQRTRILREQLCFRAAMLYAADITNADAAALDSWSKNELLPVLVTNMPFLRREVDVRTMLMALYSLRPIEDGFRLENQEELIASLANTMSPFAKKILESIDRNDQLIVISTWLVPEGINNSKRMIDTYETMRRENREEIDLADPNQSRRMLRDRSRRPPSSNRPR